ncbi:MAG: MarR family winged helix-turn-helix transcriptional regulator [Paracoccaceae bacterium]
MADAFDLESFLPYLLNRAADEASLGFAAIYKSRYGMLRTEWRVLFHLGRAGPLTARDICNRAGLHKTKVSRAVAALEKRRFLAREPMPHDRRHELLSLTAAGRTAYRDLSKSASDYDRKLGARFSAGELATLRRCLGLIAAGSRG